jgi:hypothetical protein
LKHLCKIYEGIMKTKKEKKKRKENMKKARGHRFGPG